MSKRCLWFLAFSLFSVPAAAMQNPSPWPTQLHGPCLEYAPNNTIEWPGGGPDTGFGSATAFGRIVLADLDGDQAAEGVVLVGGRAVLLDTIAVHDAPRNVVFPGTPPAEPPLSVADIATLHGAGQVAEDGTPTDGVLMTDSRGLFLVKYLTPTGPEFQEPDVIDSSNDWKNASPLHVEDLDGNGLEDILGVSPNHRSILRYFMHGGVFEAQPTITLPYDVLDVVAVDWNRSADGERELVALTRRGLYVYGKDAAGELELKQVVLHLALTGSITRFATDDACGERLAWWRPKNPPPQPPSPPTSELLVIAQDLAPVAPSLTAAPLVDGPWTMTLYLCDTTHALQPMALLAGNYDEDEYEELLVVHEANKSALMLRNVGAASHYFDPLDDEDHDVVYLADPVNGGGNVGLPAFEQLDDYGPDDLVFPVAATSKVEVFLDLSFIRADPLPGPPAVTQPYTSAGIIRDKTLFGAGVDTSDGKSRLRFNFEVPEALDTYTHIDMTIWRQPDESSPVDANAIYHARHLLDRSSPSDPTGLPGDRHQFVLIEPPGTISTTELFPPEDCWGPQDKPYFYTEFRFLKIVGGLVTRSRIFAGGFTLRNCFDVDDYSHLTDVGIPTFDFPLKDLYFVPPETSFSERQTLGAFVPMNMVPYFNDEVVPIPGALSTSVSPAQVFVEEE